MGTVAMPRSVVLSLFGVGAPLHNFFVFSSSLVENPYCAASVILNQAATTTKRNCPMGQHLCFVEEHAGSCWKGLWQSGCFCLL